MITRNVDYFRSSSTGQLIVSRFMNEEGEVEIGQAHVSFGEIDDSFYDKIHETGSIKKERGASKGEDSFLGKEYFKNKVPFSFDEGKCLVLTCFVSFETYSDESLKPISEQKGISDCFFQEKSFKEIKNLDIDYTKYSLFYMSPPRVKPPTSEEEAKDECKLLEYELDIPIFGVKGSQNIQFINGPISIGPLKFEIEPKIEKKEENCDEEDEEESEPDPDPEEPAPLPPPEIEQPPPERRPRNQLPEKIPPRRYTVKFPRWRFDNLIGLDYSEERAAIRARRDAKKSEAEKARADAEARAKAEAEAKAKAEAEAKAKAEAEAKAKEDQEEEDTEEERRGKRAGKMRSAQGLRASRRQILWTFSNKIFIRTFLLFYHQYFGIFHRILLEYYL
jgi:hypothetical protein